MTLPPLGFALILALGVVLSLAVLRRGQSRRASPFVAIVLIIQGLCSLAFFSLLPAPLRLGWALLHPFVLAFALTFTTPGERSRGWDVLIGAPAGWVIATATLSLPWALASVLVPGQLPLWTFWWAPAALALWGLVQTLRSAPERVELRLPAFAAAGAGGPGDGLPLRRAPQAALRRSGSAGAVEDGVLRVVQLTDTHIGAFMSAERLAAQCARAVAAGPDLILLTGDFLTLSSQRDAGPLTRALAPLRAHPAVYAVFGNHDHESPEVILTALRSAGVIVLNDAHTVVSTRVGPVEIAGIDFRFSQRQAAIEAVLARLPAPEGVVARVLMLHDPGMFKFVPDGRFDLTLSGHTHGGQVGLLTFGLPITLVSAFSSVPDHGPWQLGRSLLYVHRGTGHYGFPIRVGVPSEDSVIDVILPESRLPLAGGATAP